MYNLFINGYYNSRYYVLQQIERTEFERQKRDVLNQLSELLDQLSKLSDQQNERIQTRQNLIENVNKKMFDNLSQNKPVKEICKELAELLQQQSKETQEMEITKEEINTTMEKINKNMQSKYI